MTDMDSRVFYSPRDIVTLRHSSLENKPIMLVKEKVEKQLKDKEGNISNVFLGIKCIWFNKNQDIKEYIFSTKDLMHV